MRSPVEMGFASGRADPGGIPTFRDCTGKEEPASDD